MSKKASVFLKAIICIVSMLILAAVAYLGTYFSAVHCAQNGKPDTAEQLLVLPGVTALHDPHLADYIKAAQYAGKGKLDKAAKLYYELSQAEYRDSYDRMVDTLYQQAEAALQEEDFYRAQLLFDEADKLGHREAEDMADETVLLWAEDLMEKGELVDAYKKLNEIRRYSNAEELRDELTVLLYDEAVNLYRASDRTTAMQRFELIPSYKDSNKYLLLIYAHAGLAFGAEDINKLRDIFYFEDTAEVLLKTSGLAFTYLNGHWQTEDRLRAITIEDGSYSLTNFPNASYGWIEDGKWYGLETVVSTNHLYSSTRDQVATHMFTLTLTAPDTLEFFCVSDGRTYTLYRQQE